MYEAYCQGLRDAGVHVETGIFQTDMKVSLINDGPVTLLIDSREGHSEMLDIKTVTGGPLDVNTYVVALDGAAGNVLIDPGAEYAVVNGAVCGRKVTAVLLTHAHFDHMLYARPWLKEGRGGEGGERRGRKALYSRKGCRGIGQSGAESVVGIVGAQLTLPQADVLPGGRRQG